ncbi:MAG: HAMP domain-containing histidine kinase [Myxococcales bacterium]|nr:HAMP domain-containing histidine kinase [Myxococcales bacterium]
MSRRVPIAIGLVIASLVLVTGLIHLQGIFLDERDDALGAIDARRRALEQYAQKELEQRLADQLDETRPTIDRAAADPLIPASKMWLVDRGEQILPRTARPDPSAQDFVGPLYAQLASNASAALYRAAEAQDPTDPWTERLRLLEELKASLAAGDASGTEQIVRTILSHRAAYVITTKRDLAFTTAMLALLEERARPARTLMESLLRDGLQGRVSRLEGMQRTLLRELPRFSPSDVTFLRDRIVALSEPHNVLYADFVARIDEPAGEVLALPDNLSEPSFAGDGRWYVEPPRNQRVYGIAITIPAVLDEITSTMRERSLLGPEDEVKGQTRATTLPVSAIGLVIDSPTWAPAVDAVHRRYRLKAALEVAIAILVFGVMGLGLTIYRRRHRFLELKSEFVSAVSHELRTPLASIRLMAETLERRTKDLPKAKDYPTRIIRDVDALALLVENILSFDRLTRGRWTPKPATLGLASVVERLELERDIWARRSAEVHHGDLSAVELVADPDLVQLLFTNLARNATQYCERSPAVVTVSAEVTPTGAVVRVGDNGIGMPEGERENVFDDFYRSGGAKKTGERGSGLGLSICRKIMEAHGGSIRVAETGPEGTTFELIFPNPGS